MKLLMKDNSTKEVILHLEKEEFIFLFELIENLSRYSPGAKLIKFKEDLHTITEQISK